MTILDKARQAPGHFVCPVCNQHVETCITTNTPICHPKGGHLKPVAMVRTTMSATERKRRQRAKR